MHKQPTVVLLVLISVLCITACSSSAPATSDTSVPTMTTLRVWSQHDLTDQSRTTSVLMQQRVADFEAATGISVEYEQIAWDQLAPKLALAVQSGGVVPDVVETGRQHIPTLFAVGALAALDELLAAETWVTELDERDSQSCIIDGRRYCVANLVRGGITYYRTSAFPDGFPETHSAWLEAGERLQAEGMYLSTFFAGRSYASIEWAWAPWIYSNGGRIFDEQGRPAWQRLKWLRCWPTHAHCWRVAICQRRLLLAIFPLASYPGSKAKRPHFEGAPGRFCMCLICVRVLKLARCRLRAACALTMARRMFF